MFVYHFVYPDLGFEIFFQKEEATEKGRFDFGKKRLRHLRNLILCFEELFMQSLSAFLLFFSDKKRIA